MLNIIFGFGITGKAVMEFLQNKNENFAICGDDESTIPKEYFVDFKLINFSTINRIIVSPSVPPYHNFIKEAKKNGVKIISDLELFKENTTPNCKIIGITGSNGKSTTASLVYHILKMSGYNAFLGGNIGISPLVPEGLTSDIAILEVSSFQLEYTNFAFDASIILNIEPDHLTFHGTFEEYKNTKVKILKDAKFSLTSFDNENTQNLDKATNLSTTQILSTGYSYFNLGFYKNGKLIFSTPSFNNLPGMHNVQNIGFAIALCFDFFGVNQDSIINAIANFVPLQHRIEFVKNILGVEFYNDSKATNSASTITALKTFQNKNIFLIAGGRPKEIGIEALFSEDYFKCVKQVILIGEAAADFAKKIIEYNKQNPLRSIKYVIAGNLEKATLLAFTSAKKIKNSVVLLSPLCASFDQFKNFEERGAIFKMLVSQLS